MDMVQGAHRTDPKLLSVREGDWVIWRYETE